MTFDAYGVIQLLPSQPSHMLVTIFYAKANHLLKHMVIAYAKGPPASLMSASSTTFYNSSMKSLERENTTAFGDVHLASCATMKITAHGEAQQAKQTKSDKSHTPVAAVQYKTTIDRDLQIREHTRVQSDTTE